MPASTLCAALLALTGSQAPAQSASALPRALDAAAGAGAPLERLTIERVYWYHSTERAEGVAMRLDDPLEAGHLLMHVREAAREPGIEPYSEFWNSARKDFLLLAEGRVPVSAQAARGYWIFADRGLREFYLRLEPEALAQLEVGVPYRLVPPPEANGCAWVATEAAIVVLPANPLPAPDADGGGESGGRTGGDGGGDELVAQESAVSASVRTLDELLWADDPSVGSRLSSSLGQRAESTLLGHVVEWFGSAELKRFTAEADKTIWLEAPDRAPIRLRMSTGSISSSSGATRYVILNLPSGVERAHLAGATWSVVPSVEKERHWHVIGAAPQLDER